MISLIRYEYECNYHNRIFFISVSIDRILNGEQFDCLRIIFFYKFIFQLSSAIMFASLFHSFLKCDGARTMWNECLYGCVCDTLTHNMECVWFNKAILEQWQSKLNLSAVFCVFLFLCVLFVREESHESKRLSHYLRLKNLLKDNKSAPAVAGHLRKFLSYIHVYYYGYSFVVVALNYFSSKHYEWVVLRHYSYAFAWWAKQMTFGRKKRTKLNVNELERCLLTIFFSVSVMVCWSVIMNQIKRNKNSHSQRCEITLTFFSSLLNRNRLLSYHSGSAMICLEIFRPDVIDNELNQTNYQLIPIEINESNNKLRRRHSHRSLKQRSQTNTIFVFLCVRE